MANDKPMDNLLRALDEAAPQVSITETISDDYDLSPEVQQRIIDTEGVLREALALFGIDYNALVKMDENSVYAQAVQASPEVARRVAESDNPVLEALKVATLFKPYAEFQTKYGKTPDEIKANLRKEFEAEMAGNAKPEEPVEAPMFSRRGQAGSVRGDMRTFIKR